MTKKEFLTELCEKLSFLPAEEVEERLVFYLEMIDDRMEEGLSEEDAIAAIGSIDEIAEQITADIPLTKLVKVRIQSKRQLTAWETILLALGSPLWLSLLVSAVAVILALYVSLWAVIVSLWAVFVSLAVCAIACIVACIIFSIEGSVLSSAAVAGVGLVCAGLSVFMFHGCRVTTVGSLAFTGRIVSGLKGRFIKKEHSQ